MCKIAEWEVPFQYITESKCFQAIQPFFSVPESDHSSDNANQKILKLGNYHLKEDPEHNLIDDSYKNAKNQNDQAPSDDIQDMALMIMTRKFLIKQVVTQKTKIQTVVQVITFF